MEEKNKALKDTIDSNGTGVDGVHIVRKDQTKQESFLETS